MRKYLNEIPFLKDTSSSVLDGLVTECVEQTFKKGETIIYEGTEAKYFKIVKAGFVKIYAMGEQGEQSVIDILGGHNALLPSATLLGTAYPANAEAVQDVKIISIKKDIFNAYLQADKIHSQAFMEYALEHSRHSMDKLANLQMKDAYGRVGWFLLHQHIVHSVGRNDSIFLPFDKSLMASYLNMTPETFSRTIKKFKDKGFVFNKDSVTVPHLMSLCEHCSENLKGMCAFRKKNLNLCPKDY